MYAKQHGEIHHIQPLEFAVCQQCTFHACQSGKAFYHNGKGWTFGIERVPE